MSTQLIKYIEKALEQGYTPKQLGDYLLQQGYGATDVDVALSKATQNYYATSKKVSTQTTPQTTPQSSPPSTSQSSSQTTPQSSPPSTSQSSSQTTPQSSSSSESQESGENKESSLVRYIKTGLGKGYSLQQLRDHLLKKGYKATDVDEAVEAAGQNTSQTINSTQNSMTNDSTQTSQQKKDFTGGIKRRNPVVVLLLSLITFNIYFLFWLIFTTNELRNNTQSAPNPKLLLLLFVPLANIIMIFIYYWKYCKAINELTGFSGGGLFVLWIFFYPAALIISQVQLNKKAG